MLNGPYFEFEPVFPSVLDQFPQQPQQLPLLEEDQRTLSICSEPAYRAHNTAFSSPEMMPLQQGQSHRSLSPSFGSVMPEQLHYSTSTAMMVPQQTEADEPSIERGNQLLKFRSSHCIPASFDFPIPPEPITVDAELHGMFFLSEVSNTDAKPPRNAGAAYGPELTCYRRNLFQLTGSIKQPRWLQHAIASNGERLPIISQTLGISATESVDNKAVKIISVPWKTPSGSSNGSAPPPPEDKTEKEPESIRLDPSTRRDYDNEFVTYPIGWKRLQFRTATANNGRRKELQQHFIIKLSLEATLANGEVVVLSESRSGPVVVRGRSPRNFSARKDVPLVSSAAASRRGLGVMSYLKRQQPLPPMRPSPTYTSPTDYNSASTATYDNSRQYTPQIHGSPTAIPAYSTYQTTASQPQAMAAPMYGTQLAGNKRKADEYSESPVAYGQHDQDALTYRETKMPRRSTVYSQSSSQLLPSPGLPQSEYMTPGPSPLPFSAPNFDRALSEPVFDSRYSVSQQPSYDYRPDPNLEWSDQMRDPYMRSSQPRYLDTAKCIPNMGQMMHPYPTQTGALV